MPLTDEDNYEIEFFTGILNENIGKTLFIEYLENNNLHMQPFEVLQQVSNDRVQVNRVYDNTTLTKDLSVINN